MKAIQFSQTGGLEVLKYVDVPDPKPKPGQALINIKAIGVNFGEVAARKGLNPVALPAIPGGEAAGIVSEIGEDVHEVAVGDLVTYFARGSESYAEKAVVPSWRLVKLPPDIDFEIGVACTVHGMTAYFLSHSFFPLRPGDTALVHAAAGGVGFLLTQMAKLSGAKVIGTVSSAARAQLAREAGADHTINYIEGDFEEEVKRITNGAGVQVVYDAVGKTTFEKSLACLSRLGYMGLYGQTSGPVPPVPLSTLTKSIFLTRPSMSDYAPTGEALAQLADNVFELVRTRKLKVRIHGKFPLKDAAEAHRLLEDRQTTGKLLLIP